MTRKPTTKSPDERRLRKHIRELLQVYAADTSKLNTDATVRMFLELIDDEVRRARMSMAPVTYPTPTSFKKADAYIKGIIFDDEISPMTDAEYKERTHIKKVLAAAALDGTLTFGGK